MARDLLLEKHEEEPCLSEKEYKKIKMFTASEKWGRKFARQMMITSFTLHGEGGDVVPKEHTKRMEELRALALE